jgi:hypothetical protein
MVVSDGRCEDEVFEDEGDALGELVEKVKALYVKLEKLKVEHACCSFEGDVERFPVLGEDVGHLSHDGEVEDCIAIEVEYFSPNSPTVLDLNEEIVVYSDEEKYILASIFDDLGETNLCMKAMNQILSRI